MKISRLSRLISRIAERTPMGLQPFFQKDANFSPVNPKKILPWQTIGSFRAGRIRLETVNTHRWDKKLFYSFVPGDRLLLRCGGRDFSIFQQRTSFPFEHRPDLMKMQMVQFAAGVEADGHHFLIVLTEERRNKHNQEDTSGCWEVALESCTRQVQVFDSANGELLASCSAAEMADALYLKVVVSGREFILSRELLPRETGPRFEAELQRATAPSHLTANILIQKPYVLRFIDADRDFVMANVNSDGSYVSETQRVRLGEQVYAVLVERMFIGQGVAEGQNGAWAVFNRTVVSGYSLVVKEEMTGAAETIHLPVDSCFRLSSGRAWVGVYAAPK